MTSSPWTGNEADYDMVDLTHVLREGMPFWHDHPRFSMKQASSLEDGAVASVHAVCLCEHTGTHFDAPSHFILGGKTITEFPVQKFFGRAAMIEVKNPEPDSSLPAQAILDFEARNGPLQDGDAVIFNFGWYRLWPENEKFLKDWPGISEEAAQVLARRGVRLCATDCLSIDHFTSEAFRAHVTLLGANILIGENFANVGRLPPWFFLTALPLPIDKGTGSPVRAVAFVPKN